MRVFQKQRRLIRAQTPLENTTGRLFVNYREFLNLALGSGSLSFLSVIISWTTIAINIPMMISYFKVSTGFIFVAGIIASVLGLIRAPILSMLIDNSNYKKGNLSLFAVELDSYRSVFYIYTVHSGKLDCTGLL